MQLRNTSQSYGLVARFLHWSMFLLIGLTTFLALNMEAMSEADKALTEGVHRSIGVLILVLLVLRFAWKLGNPQPVDPPGPAWMNMAAHLVHWLIYCIILLQAVAGIVMSQAGGDAVSLFDVFTLPVLVSPDPDVQEAWEEVHETNWIILWVLIVGHVMAALHHHFGDRDDVFSRMWIDPR